MNNQNRQQLDLLIRKGVRIPHPATVEVGPEVDPDRVWGEDVTIHPGCRIHGAQTLILPGAKLGEEGPTTIQDCQLGAGVELKGGYFRRSVFLDRVSLGPGAQVRDACLLEEEARGAQAVGLKQTILFPFVTLGSLVNFCDCLMAGGTSRQNHSEVGSSYIHFNYTPNQDKATASLIGDVPRGVMLNQRPIFLGGQGGLVGPSRLGYGTVIAAGTIYRGDCPEGGKMISGEELKPEEGDFHPGVYWSIRRRVVNNINFIANLIALRQWYLHVRSLFFTGEQGERELHRGAMEKLEMGISERIKRLGALAEKMPYSRQTYQKILKAKASPSLLSQKKELFDQWPALEEMLTASREERGDGSSRDTFLKELGRQQKEKDNDYLKVISELSAECSKTGISWLESVVGGINHKVLKLLPSFR